MASNSFGNIFKFTSFGESHGKAIGCIVDGIPPLISIKENLNIDELNLKIIKVSQKTDTP